jgi:hypothetical protein
MLEEVELTCWDGDASETKAIMSILYVGVHELDQHTATVTPCYSSLTEKKHLSENFETKCF